MDRLALAVSRPAARRRVTARMAAVVTAALVMVAMLIPAQLAHADESEDGFASRINAARASAGLPGLTQVAELQAVARKQAQAMASSNKLYHNPDLATDVTNWSRLTENVGYGGDVESVHVAFMNSAGHRANILDSGVTQVGIGVVWAGTRLWVAEVFRMPTGAAASQPAASSPAPAPAPTVAFAPTAACAGVPGAPFTDVPRNSWYVGAVDCAVSKSLANGVTATTYAPANSVTRAQMASFVNRILLRSKKATPYTGPDLFGDDAGSPHENAINTLAALGVLNGTAPGAFSPQLPVTRGQMASMLVRLQESLSGPMAAKGVPFTDVASSPHAASIDKVFTAGITSGTSATTFSPNANVRRDGMSVFLVRTFSGLNDTGAVS